MEAVFTRPYDDTSRLPQAAPSRVLVVSDPDHANAADALRNTFESHGFEVVSVSSLADAVASAGTHTVNVAVVDLEVSRGRGRTTPGSGLDLIGALRQADHALPIIALTPNGAFDLAVEAMRRGAREVLEKPLHEGRLMATLRCQDDIGRSLRRAADLEAEVSRLRSNGSSPAGPFADMRLLDVEGTLVKQAMDKFGGNISRTARALGLSRSALYRRLERHKLDN